MSFYVKVTLILLIGCPSILSQNLVPNNSFEKYKKCPERDGEFNKSIIDWRCPNKGTSDYFNNCSPYKTYSTSNNFGGNQIPYSGFSYVGIILFSTGPGGGDYREYVQCKLTEPLKANRIYCCSFYINLADNSDICVDKVGLYLSKKKIKTHDKLFIKVKPQIESPTGLFLSSSTDWVLICDTFKALGSEEYITIGNFYNDKNTLYKKINQKRKKNINKNDYYYVGDNAYYYIDEVSVQEITNPSECNCSPTAKDSLLVVKQTKPRIDSITPQLGETVLLKDLVFETNKSEILPVSFDELNKLVNYLTENLNYKIELLGHTDNIGKEEENQKLSEARAKAVGEYLISKGIIKERVSYLGYGSRKPKTSNETEEGRQENRRVEFMIK